MVKAKVTWVPRLDGTFPKGRQAMAYANFGTEDYWPVLVELTTPPALVITANVKIMGEDAPQDKLTPGTTFTLFDGEDPRGTVEVLA